MKRLFSWRVLLALVVVGCVTVLVAYSVAFLVATHPRLPTENRTAPKDPRISELKARSPAVQDTISPFKVRDRE